MIHLQRFVTTAPEIPERVIVRDCVIPKKSHALSQTCIRQQAEPNIREQDGVQFGAFGSLFA